ncbi:hypothetical protein LENED_000291 [Lentinula edodes]|uniref:Uncharacterized protein n=1 Tax=Lentinula edodes TaxID=5353 RepID=A0A1Q3DVB1_LENED|nr:hypothetical protein LENED_000291 [Lentinula edodes]
MFRLIDAIANATQNTKRTASHKVLQPRTKRRAVVFVFVRSKVTSEYISSQRIGINTPTILVPYHFLPRRYTGVHHMCEVARTNFDYFDVMQQWEVMMEYEERMMRIQETILDLSLETHNLHDIHLQDPSTLQEKSVQLYPEQTPPTSESLPTLSIPMFIPTSTVPLSLPTFIPTSIPTPIRRLFLNCIYHLRRIRRIAECYCDLRRLRTEIHISEQMSRREQVRWGLQVSKLRRASMP